MHTYLKNGDDTYSVGMWLPNRDGVTSFWKLVTVDRLYDAARLVNALNGGTPITHLVLKAVKVEH